MELKFLGYVVNESSLKLNQIPKGVTNFTVNPNIGFDIKKDPKKFTLGVTVAVKGTDEKPAPFDLFVKITGNFDIVHDSLNIDRMRIDASRILFPYVRSYVTAFTAISNMPPYNLPVIDFEQTPLNKQSPIPPQPPKKSSGIDGITIRPLDEV